jgi:anti-sigma factor ChrR (cupin superfamily)
MECKDYREQFSSLLTDTLGQAERSKIETHLAGCADCRREFEAASKIWDLMGDIPQPEPSKNMRAGFDSILSNFKEELVARKNPVSEWLNKLTEY